MNIIKLGSDIEFVDNLKNLVDLSAILGWMSLSITVSLEIMQPCIKMI